MQASQQLNKPESFGRASFHQRLTAGGILFALLVVFGLFWFAGQGRIDLGRWLGPACGFKQRYNLPCPACGMTTAIMAFFQGRISEAFYIQPAAALLCCIMVAAAFLAFLTVVFGVYYRVLIVGLTKIRLIYIVLVLIAILAAGWAVTLIRALVMGNRV